MGTAVAIIAICATWVVTGVVLVGCGFFFRLVLARIVLGERVRVPAVSDLWIGLAALAAYLEAWSFFLPTSGYTWFFPIATTSVAAVVALRRRPFTSISWSREATAVTAFAGLALLWLADRSLGPAENYDSGLYHTGVVEYAARFRVIPGLGNLHDRFSNSNSHLLFVAYLDQGPWAAGAGIHIANGMLLSALLVDICLRFVVHRESALTSFTDRLAILLVPAAATVVAWQPDSRISSPELDVSTFLVVVVGALYLGEIVERGFATAPALSSVGGFATAATTRALYWVPALLAAGIVIACAWRRKDDRARARVTVFVGALPVALATGWLGRQAILSGYPLLPLKIGALPVDWRMPPAAVDEVNSWVKSWAREPGVPPDLVLANWHWLRPWLRTRLTKETDVLVPLAVLASTLPLALIPCDDPHRAHRTRPMLAVLGVALLTVLVWFVVAPEPRFAFAPIWLVPLALAAWALPPAAREALVPATIATIAAAALLSAVAAYALGLFLPAVTIVWVMVGIAVLCVPAAQAWVATAALGSVLLAGVALSAGHGHAFRPLQAVPGGPLGTAGVPHPQVGRFVTNSGLRLTRPVPVGKEFRCWQLILCTAYPNPALRLRGDGLASGLTVEQP